MKFDQKRVLLVDDNDDIHKAFHKVLEINRNNTYFSEAKSMVFEHATNSHHEQILPSYKIDSAYQGQEALELVKKAMAIGQPYALAFVDIRMPPGWNGIETIKAIWKVDPNIQQVICTAYSDYSWEEISKELNNSDNFLILKKPFDAIEIYQLAAALTKKWELNHRVRQQIETLEATVQQRTAELRHAKEIAETANQFKNDFLENISLELRTPLNSIKGFAELMCTEQITFETQKEYSLYILLSARHLYQMINDMLDISKLESGKIELHPEPINLDKLVNEMKDIYHGLIAEKHLQFTIKIDPTLTHIIIDSIKLKQVIFHYISNAIKFTPDEGCIEIRIFPVEKGQFRIEVVDTGIGIRKEDIDKLYATFQPLDSNISKKYPGTGIGLALIRRIVEFQGGQVGVESTLGKGSTFFAILPCAPLN